MATRQHEDSASLNSETSNSETLKSATLNSKYNAILR